jgi:hypothetical protein
MFNFSANHLAAGISVVRRILMCDRDTQRVYRLHDFSKAHHIRPDVVYCVAGKSTPPTNSISSSNRSDRTRNTAGLPLLLFLLTAREDRLCADASVSISPPPRRPALSPAACAFVRPDVETGAFGSVIPGQNAALLFRR